MLSGSGVIDSMKVMWTLLCQQLLYQIPLAILRYIYNAFFMINIV